jgi:hypothetical protein
MDRETQGNECNENLQKTLNITRELMVLADQGDAVREDIGCGILYGTIRDCAYKIRSLAQAEITQHKKTGRWLENSAKISQTSRE